MLDPGRSVLLNLSELCFKPGAYFLDEFDRLFVSHFGRVRHYRAIVEFLATRGFATRDKIAKRLGLRSGGRISGFLENLCLAGFIEGYAPVHNPDSTYLRRYRVADPLLALGTYTIEKVLISAYPPTKELEDEGYFSRILTADDLAAS